MPFDQTDDQPAASGGLMPRASIHQLVASKTAAAQAFGQAWETMQRAYELANAAAPSGASDVPHLAGGSPYGRSGHVTWKTRDEFEAYVARELDRRVWRHVVKATQLDQLMDKQEREAFTRALEGEPPPATVENIAATVERLIGDADLIFKRGIANAFAKLDRRFRSHDGFKIGGRVVLSRAFSEFGTWNHYQSHDDTLVDVERTFYRLDGKPQPERYGGIVGKIEESKRAQGLRFQGFEVESDYFRVVAFKNGNAHLWFKRKDLVAKVNQLLADYYGATLGAGADVADVKHAFSTVPAKNMGWFATPETLAQRALDEASVYRRGTYSGDYPKLRVLEPSAGEGAIAGLAAAAGHEVACVELDPGRAQTLRASGLYRQVLAADFLKLAPADLGEKFDRIVMNPPFSHGGPEIDHVVHALDFLADGGRLTAILPAGVEFREDRKAQDFRAMVERRGGRFYDLPPGSFAPATNVNTVLLVIGGRR